MIKKTLLLLSIVLTTTLVSAQDSDAIVDTWLTQEGLSKVDISKQSDGTYIGKIIWLKYPKREDGSIKKDRNNPDESLRDRNTVGLKILEGFSYNKEDQEWVDGTVYDPKTGSTYKCYMWFDDDTNILNVKGYIGFSLMGKTVEWTRLSSKAAKP